MHRIIFSREKSCTNFSPGNAKISFRSGRIPHMLTFTFLCSSIYEFYLCYQLVTNLSSLVLILRNEYLKAFVDIMDVTTYYRLGFLYRVLYGRPERKVI